MYKIGGESIIFIENESIVIVDKKYQTVIRFIIDGFILGTEIIQIVMLLLKNICIVLNKYCVSFQLNRCDLLKDRVKYVGDDLLYHGIFPSYSTLNIIIDWPNLTISQILHSLLRITTYIN